MAYEKQNFKNGLVLLASQLNHIEDGIVTLENRILASDGNVVQGASWTTAQIDLLDSLFSAIPWTTGTAGALADSLIASLRSTSSGSGGNTGGGSGGESGGEDEPETGATDNITQSGNTLIITSLATAPIQSGSVLTIA